MRWTSGILNAVLFSGCAGDLVAKSGASAVSAPPGRLFEPCRIEALALRVSWWPCFPARDELLVGLLGLPDDLALLIPQSAFEKGLSPI